MRVIWESLTAENMRESIVLIEWSGLPNLDWKVSLWYLVEGPASRSDARYLCVGSIFTTEI